MRVMFFLIAALMLCVALALLLVPLLKAARRQGGHARGTFALALGMAFALPLVAVGLYMAIGTPAALQGVTREPTAGDIDQAIAALRKHLAEQPDDAQGWALLGRTLLALQRPAEAREAFGRLLERAPDDTSAMLGWAEADAQARPDHRLEGRALELLQRVAAREPDNQRALWLLGIAAYQQGHYQEAIEHWQRLLPQLEAGSPVAQSVAAQIDEAKRRLGQPPMAMDATPSPPQTPTAASSTAASQPPATGAALTVEVRVAPALAGRIGKGDTLFVYARDAQGPAMPLAVARLDAATLPATVTLTDAMAMTPQHRLSSARRVFVGARVSKSGQALAQPGDLEGDAGVVELKDGARVAITLDRVR